MHDDTIEPFCFPAVGRKKLTAAFDGGRLTSDGGVMLVAAAERRIGIAQRLAGLIADPRNPLLVTHSVVDILRARMLAIACGYEDADDLDHLRSDPGFKLACGRLPDTGDDLCSQPTMSRWENAPTLARGDPHDLRHDRRLLRQLPQTAGGRHAGHRRHRRCRARPSATFVVQRALRRTLLPADPRLRDRHLPSGGGSAATRQDPIGRRSSPSSAPAGTSHPQPLADHAADDPWRRSLQPSRGDGVVRGQRCGLMCSACRATPC